MFRPELIFILLVLAFFVGWAYHHYFYRFRIRIVIGPQGLIQVRGISENVRSNLESFFGKDVHLSSKVIIWGRIDHTGRIRFVFSGSIDPGTKQQIRNYLVATL